MTLHLVPVRSRDARAFVEMWHRHHQPPVGQLFAVGVADDAGVLRGVAIVGRPVARHLDNGQTAEVTRTATDGTRNANSMLYGACWRAAQALGYTRLITYTQAGESGASLRGAGWRIVAQRPARAGWTCPSRPRQTLGTEHHPANALGSRVTPQQDARPGAIRPGAPRSHHSAHHQENQMPSEPTIRLDQLDTLLLAPLARMIATTIQATPVRLGTPEGSADLTGALALAVAAYMGRELGPDPAQAGAVAGHASVAAADGVTVRATRYEVNCLPEDDHGQCLAADGTWDYESVPSERTDEWLATPRHDLDTALALAREAAPRVTVNGWTVPDALRMHAATTDEERDAVWATVRARHAARIGAREAGAR